MAGALRGGSRVQAKPPAKAPPKAARPAAARPARRNAAQAREAQGLSPKLALIGAVLVLALALGVTLATGHRGTYLWVIEDANGMSAAYFYPPNGAQGRCLECGAATPACEEIAPLEPSKGKTYRTCVDHDQAEPCSDSRSSSSSSALAMLWRRTPSRWHIARIIEISHSSKSIISCISIPTISDTAGFGTFRIMLLPCPSADATAIERRSVPGESRPDR